MREKLIALLSGNISEFCKLSVIRGTTKITGITFDADRFADHLIANGVTIPVRCKDCEEWDEEEQECKHWYGFSADDFCSYGERRTDGNTTDY